jgi:hypothetical protein
MQTNTKPQNDDDDDGREEKKNIYTEKNLLGPTKTERKRCESRAVL